MRPFESFAAPNLEDYIKHRISLGYSDHNLRSLLLYFDRYIVDNDVFRYTFDPKFYLEFREKLKGEPATINGVISVVRNYFQYLVDLGYWYQNPLIDIPALPSGQYFPYIFTSKQTEELIKSIDPICSSTSNEYFEHVSIYLSILLMARCGLRISEPVGILVKHYCQHERTIYIEKTKFKVDRLIPVPKSTTLEINNYLSMRYSLYSKHKNSHLLVGKNLKPLSSNQIYKAFHQAVKDIGLNERKKKIGNISFGSPTPHSLRHSFAVNTLNRIKAKGNSIWDALPILSVFMGHRNISSTSKYLTVLNAQHRQQLLDFITFMQEEL